ncbi:minor capsid protein [Streptacidiphilus sp. EB103A]|uniref:minor capsid protein n=1 Tax=Streptacidiphilus sp. EB103A TaxID=3156275 RepID=UPI0035194DF1
MADLLDGLAQHLMAAGLVEYEPTGVTGDCFIETMPAAPDSAVVLSLYGGQQPDSRLGYDYTNLQVRVRGDIDPRTSRTRATALYNELQGLGPLTLPDGTLLLSCNAIQTPTLMGQDDQRRFEHVTNYALEIRSITAHRV